MTSFKAKKVLVTAGNTRVPIDLVRGIDNIFKGGTGAAIANYCAEQGCEVTLLASHPFSKPIRPDVRVVKYSTYDALFSLMKSEITEGGYDIVIHSAAVSDYRVDEICKVISENVETGERVQLEAVKLDRSGKIGSDFPTLWMKLVPTLKIVDQIRNPWGFKGTLVKFKLQIEMSDEELIKVARKSMRHSNADIIVANTLEGMNDTAFIIRSEGGSPVRAARASLPATLYKEFAI